MRKNRGKTLVKVIVALILICALAVGVMYYRNQFVEKYESKIATLEEEINAHQKVIFVAMEDIKAGETLELEINVTTQVVMSGIESNLYISAEDLGKQAVLNISESIPIMKNMVSDRIISDDTRTYDTSTVVLMADQTDYDVVDIRIMFPDGEDFCVISKKTITGVNLDTCRFNMELNEEEILRLKCALVDAYTVTGSMLYTVRYIEPALQKATIPNYPVRNTTLTLLQSDPNVVTFAKETMSATARQELEKKLLSLTEEQLDAVSSGNQIGDTAHSSVLLNGTYISDEYIDSSTTVIVDQNGNVVSSTPKE